MGAILALADGTIFYGESIGVAGSTVGEVVFNTSMTGYQEILTDPSYTEQIITFSYPHIGNVGVNAQDMESSRIWAKGLVIRDCSLTHSNWRSEGSLPQFLQDQKVVAISEIDTRKLIQIIRDNGAQGACISTDVDDIEGALSQARDFAGLNGMDLASQVSCKSSYNMPAVGTSKYKVVVYDFGVKRQILNILVGIGCELIIVPATTSFDEVISHNPDGVFLSNGPGDPKACDYAIKNIQALLEQQIPLYGICLGFQLLCLACGAKSIKMKFGHHGANHPVIDLFSNNKVAITSQNHGFAIDEDSLPEVLQVTHRSLFDDSLQGVSHIKLPVFGFQGHPEAGPGPHDVYELFDKFINAMQKG